jgi:hypothetical protein
MKFKNTLFSQLFFVLMAASAVNAQDTLRLMNYNLLFFPSSNPTKHKHLKTIVEYYKPDVLAVNELENFAGSVTILDSALNANGEQYSSAQFFPNTNISNFLYFNNDKLGYHSQRVLYTQPRNTNVYKLYYKNQDFSLYPDTLYLHFLVVHFKSSQGADNVQLRANQSQAIRTYLDVLPSTNNTFLLGDFNMYTSNEAGYQILLADGNGKLIDPINRPGNWNNNSAFADIHTQSPRTISFDNGVTGGLDDRFDINLVSTPVMSGFTGVKYIPNTYQSLGNDGLHFNRSLIDLPTNTSAPDSIIQALYLMSDHLPVMMSVQTIPQNVINAIKPLKENNFGYFDGWNGILYWNKSASGTLMISDLSGRLVQQINVNQAQQTELYFPNQNGIYLIRFQDKNQNTQSWKWVVSR